MYYEIIGDITEQDGSVSRDEILDDYVLWSETSKVCAEFAALNYVDNVRVREQSPEEFRGPDYVMSDHQCGNFRVVFIDDPEGGYFQVVDVRTGRLIVNSMRFTAKAARERALEAHNDEILSRLI